MTTPKNEIALSITATARFRAELVALTGSNQFSAENRAGEWRETYEQAEADLGNMLVDRGAGYVGEINKLYATSNTWAKVDADLAAKEAAVAK